MRMSKLDLRRWPLFLLHHSADESMERAAYIAGGRFTSIIR